MFPLHPTPHDASVYLVPDWCNPVTDERVPGRDERVVKPARRIKESRRAGL